MIVKMSVILSGKRELRKLLSMSDQDISVVCVFIDREKCKLQVGFMKDDLAVAVNVESNSGILFDTDVRTQRGMKRVERGFRKNWFVVPSERESVEMFLLAGKELLDVLPCQFGMDAEVVRLCLGKLVENVGLFGFVL